MNQNNVFASAAAGSLALRRSVHDKPATKPGIEMVTLKQLRTELNIEPREARERLRLAVRWPDNSAQIGLPGYYGLRSHEAKAKIQNLPETAPETVKTSWWNDRWRTVNGAPGRVTQGDCVAVSGPAPEDRMVTAAVL